MTALVTALITALIILLPFGAITSVVCLITALFQGDLQKHVWESAINELTVTKITGGSGIAGAVAELGHVVRADCMTTEDTFISEVRTQLTCR